LPDIPLRKPPFPVLFIVQPTCIGLDASTCIDLIQVVLNLILITT
jgi:hypothetical protein